LIAVDTNILIYAHRNRFTQHAQALSWLKHLAEGSLPWAIPVFCIGEFVQVVTHPRILDPPSTILQAFSALEGLLQSPTLRILYPGSRFLEIFRAATETADARGNLVFDAQIVALCEDQGVSRLLTADRDFARFKQLTIIPLETPIPG
jgi:toxin-antitoxin system PIN domain toxin